MIEDHPADISAFKPGHVLAGYRLEAKIGEGGTAAVYRARDERLRRLVALKILSPELSGDPAFRRRFVGESDAIAAVDHPHIIPVYDRGEIGGVLFIAMRFVAGGDLRSLMLRAGQLSPGRAAEIISPVASALDAAHEARLVHRDVKPGNILLDTGPGRPDHVLLSDFGVSKRVATSVTLTGSGQFIGTAGYAAPEQIQELEVDGHADQYALACVAYELLAGEPLFPRSGLYGVLIAHVHDRPPSLTSRRPDLPFAANRVMAKALAKEPEERYATCTAFTEALREALGLPPYYAGGAVISPVREPVQGTPSIFVPVQGPQTARVPLTAEPLPVPPPPTSVEEPQVPAPPLSGKTVVEGTAFSTGLPRVTREPAPASVTPEPKEAEAEAAEEPAPPPELETLPGPAPAPTEAAPELVTDAVDYVSEPGTAAAQVAPDVTVAVPVVPDVTAGEPGVAAGETDAFAVAADVTVVVPVVPGAPADDPGVAAVEADAPVGTDGPVVPDVTVAVPVVPGVTAGEPGVAAGETDAPVDKADALLPVSDVPLPAPETLPPAPDVPLPAPGARPATSESGPDGLIDEMTAPAPARDRRRRLSLVAGAAVIIGVAVAIPVVLRSPPQPPQPVTPSPTVTPSPPIPVTLHPTPLALPADFGGNDKDFPGLVTSVAINPPGTTIAIAGVMGTCLWNIAAGRCTVSAAPSYAVAFSPDGNTLVGSDDPAMSTANGIVQLSSTATGRPVKSVPAVPDSAGALSVAYSPDGKTVAVGDQNGNVYLLDIATGQWTPLPNPGSRGINAVTFNPSGTELVAGAANGDTYLWNVTTRQRVATLGNPDPDSISTNGGVESVAWSHNGKWLATGDADGSSYLWNAANGKLIKRFPDPVNPVPGSSAKGVLAVAFSPDDTVLAAGGDNQSAYLWKVSSGAELATLPYAQGRGVTSLAFGKDGKTLVTGNFNGTVESWDTGQIPDS